MAKMIQIRHVPDAVHRKLKARAAKKRMSLSNYLLNEIEAMATRPTMAEWLAELHKDEPVTLAEPSYVTVRRLRDSR